MISAMFGVDISRDEHAAVIYMYRQVSTKKSYIIRIMHRLVSNRWLLFPYSLCDVKDPPWSGSLSYTTGWGCPIRQYIATDGSSGTAYSYTRSDTCSIGRDVFFVHQALKHKQAQTDNTTRSYTHDEITIVRLRYTIRNAPSSPTSRNTSNRKEPLRTTCAMRYIQDVVGRQRTHANQMLTEMHSHASLMSQDIHTART
jgi:hypothetical protein